MYLTVFLLLTFFSQAFAQQPGCLKPIDFFIGEWNLSTRDMQQNGSIAEGEARSNAYYILDGRAIQDDFRSIDRSGNVEFRGTSIRSCDEDRSKYIIAWLMPGKEGITDLRATWSEGILSGEGEGYDEFGAFMERFTYFNITDSSYSFRMQRSYDEGRTWLQNFSSIEATKKQ